MTENQPRTFDIVFNGNSAKKFQEHYTIEVWCDGRYYEWSTESYHPCYSYRITAPNWEYVGNDLYGGANEISDNTGAAKSLFAFLIAAQEGLPEDTEGKSENAELFPPHVRENFAYLCKEELIYEYVKLEKELL